MGETTEFSVLLDRLGDPVDLGVPPDGFVERINEDDLKVLVSGVLANPVGAQNTKTLDTTAYTFFSNGLKVSDGLHLVHLTRSLRLPKGTSFGDRTFAPTTSHGDAVDDVALLVLVAEPSGLIGPGGFFFH